MLQINRITKRFGHTLILDQVSLHMKTGEKAALVGANGSGKSTLFQIITGDLKPDSGSIIRSKGERLGYLPQNPAALKAENVVQALLGEHWLPVKNRRLQSKEEGRALATLAALGLPQLSLSQPVASLSGGELTRVHLSALLLAQPQVLLLDEPTNHLDIRALEWLEQEIKHYRGTILLISHDRVFLDRTIEAVFELDDISHKIEKYVGDYSSYAEQKKAGTGKGLRSLERPAGRDQALDG